MVGIVAGLLSGQSIKSLLTIERLVYSEYVLHHKESLQGKMVKRVVIGDQDLWTFASAQCIFDLSF